MLITNLMLLAPPSRPRPLASIDHAKALLDIEEDTVTALLDCGRLMFAFDLRVPSARRPFWRLYTPGLLAFLRREPQPQDLDAVIADVLPKPVLPTLRAPTLRRCFNIAPSHVHDLVNGGAFTVVKAPARGCGNGALLARASVESFLRARLYG